MNPWVAFAACLSILGLGVFFWVDVIRRRRDFDHHCAWMESLHQQYGQAHALLDVARQKHREANLFLFRRLSVALPQDRVLGTFRHQGKVHPFTVGDLRADRYPEVVDLWLRFAATTGGVAVLHALDTQVPDLTTSSTAMDSVEAGVVVAVALGCSARDKAAMALEIVQVMRRAD